jgi:hypothetical protein
MVTTQKQRAVIAIDSNLVNRKASVLGPSPSKGVAMTNAKLDLESCVGKSITDVCEHGFISPTENHCAHFVGHALGIKVGILCGDMKFKTRHQGASIRCDDLYNGLWQRGLWAERPAYIDPLLIFVISSRHMVKDRMSNFPQKHVGICLGGRVFNFSNSRHQVVVDDSVESFHAKFRQVYSGNDISLYFAVAP